MVASIVSLILVVVCSCIAYSWARRAHRETIAKLILNSDGNSKPTPDDQFFSILSEERQRRVYSNAMTAVDKLAMTDSNGEYEDRETRETNLKSMEKSIEDAIHIIALGNKVTEQEVRQIVRRGWSRNW